MRPILPLFAALCGLLAAPAFAKPVPDRITRMDEGGILTMAETGEVSLAYIAVPPGVHPAAKRGSVWQVQRQGTDRYGRTLAILTRPGDKSKTALQEDWLRQGQALIYSPASFRQLKKWQQAEEEARAARRGIWAGNWRVTPQQAAQHLQQFAFVEGRVTRTYKSRDTYYINFGEDWRTDFSIAIPRKAWRSFRDDLEVPDGSLIRVRGTIISENGPMIVVTRPEQIERL